VNEDMVVSLNRSFGSPVECDPERLLLSQGDERFSLSPHSPACGRSRLAALSEEATPLSARPRW
jgi:hypothetical protein